MTNTPHILFAASLLLLSFTSANAEWYSDEQDKMGTLVEVRFWSEDKPGAEALLSQGMAEFERIEALMSTYIASSEMSRINRDAAKQPQVISVELFQLIQQALDLSVITNGAFDISYDSVGNLYDFRERVRPDAMEIAGTLQSINYRNIVLNDDELTISFLQPGMRINLGGIAKGYAVEQVVALLREAGVEHALATAGGDTRILGDRRDKPWIVGIRDPDKDGAIFTRLALVDEAISTSGDYERYFIEDGDRYHHILSPADGRPVTGVRSVTIVGPDATMTDGLSTSVFVLGPQAGLDLIATLPDYEAVVITDGQLYYSDGLNPG
jgi:thiamine biosynthesis lipoprotein